MRTFKIGGVPEHFNFPWKLAQDFKFFEKDNLKIQWTFYPSGTGAMVNALKNKELDIAILLTEGAVASIINGLEAKIIKQFISSPLIWGVHTGFNSNISQVKENLKYSISRFNSGSHLMAIIDAKIRNFNINEHQWVISNDLNGSIHDLNTHASDLFLWEKYTTKPYVNKGLLRKISEFVTPWSCFQIVASNQLLNEFPDEIRKIMSIINFTSKQFMTSDNSIDMLIENYELTPEDAHSWFYSTEWNTDFNISEKMLENVMNTLLQIQIIQKKLKPEELIHPMVNLI